MVIKALKEGSVSYPKGQLQPPYRCISVGRLFGKLLKRNMAYTHLMYGQVIFVQDKNDIEFITLKTYQRI